MNMLDRGVLYGGVLLAVILGAVGLSEIKKIKPHPPDGVKGFMGGPIQITTSAGHCVVQEGELELYNAEGISVQWQQQPPAAGAQDYYVIFQKNQDPFGTGPDSILVPKTGKASAANSVSSSAVSDCGKYQECVYPYTITTDQAGTTSCLNGSDSASTYGIVIKNP